MSTQSNEVNQIMEEIAEFVYDKYQWMSVGVGTALIADDAVNLTNGTSVDISSYNKLKDSTPVVSGSLSGRNMSMLFILEPGEPVNQPINIGEVGLMSSKNEGDTLGIGAKLNVAQTKDNTVRQKWRMSLAIKRQNEV